MEIIPLRDLTAGVKINRRLIVAVDFQEVWVKIYFDRGEPMVLRNLPNSTVATTPAIINGEYK